VLTVTGGGDISLIARDDTTQLLLAGGVSASFGSGVGAAVVTVVSGKDVRAEAYRASAAGNLSISAENQDEIDQLAISAGISGASAVQIGAAVQVLRSSAKAKAGGMGVALTSQAGNFSLTSQNDVDLYNIGAAVGIAGGSAVTPVGVVTYFQGESDARLRGGSRVELKKNGKNINIQATSDKEINLYSVGASIGSNAVSGAANVLISKDNASAVAESGTEMTTGGDVNIHANGDYKLRSASAALSAGANAVGVNAVVSVMKSNTLADLSGAVNGQTGKAKNMNVTSSAKRDVINAVANVSAGANGIGVSAFVLIAGTKMSQDAAGGKRSAWLPRNGCFRSASPLRRRSAGASPGAASR